MTAIAERVRGLSEAAQLTQSEVGRIVGASPRTVARWAAGEVEPQPDARDRLLQLNYVATQLVEVLGLTSADANVWLFEPSRELAGDTPADRLAAGDFRSVIAVIGALADGVVL
jgi:transcriptional regulator with XRE-family HTH domain